MDYESHGNEEPAVAPVTFEWKVLVIDELNAFVRYSRLGLFHIAQELYGEVLEDYETSFAVIAEYADSLLEQGRFRDLSKFLQKKVEGAKKLDFELAQMTMLRLLKGLADIHSVGNLCDALRQARLWRKGKATSLTPENLTAVDVS